MILKQTKREWPARRCTIFDARRAPNGTIFELKFGEHFGAENALSNPNIASGFVLH